MRFDKIWLDACLATLAPDQAGLGVVKGAALAVLDGRIAFAGPMTDLPADWDAAELTTLDGRWITPGLIDCHTHLVFAGNRADEFERRLEGDSYEQIAQEGGGIRASVRATRAADEATLLIASLKRLDRLLAEGVTTIEIKSGYGLDHETEARMLRVARQLGRQRAVDVRTSYLGAHALPEEYGGDKDRYIDDICSRILPTIAREGLADAVDAFCERIAFSPAQVGRVFDAARGLGLPVKLHADQLSNLGGAALAAHHGALSADHLEYCDDAGATALAAAGTVAVLLPGAFYMLREPQAPPVAAFRRHGTRIAIATDCNPGTAPMVSLLLAMNMAATLFRLTVTEVIAGVTREAARALGAFADRGSLETGKRADLAIWDVEKPVQIFHELGANPLCACIRSGA